MLQHMPLFGTWLHYAIMLSHLFIEISTRSSSLVGHLIYLVLVVRFMHTNVYEYPVN